ncbi:polymer-forming cytoskeletal protein [Arenibacter sp. M-2]|uniref:polymer-forming cytoskeletal protein n=1 Tax=Arenibacter sp. M-2 TaxID=3053612 RepID=UPI00257024D9|nr:polymer-forming cytoskeletal protein [Arenibacter sp. M-2]MDL5514850.1 polymer-forming cytoskeletal protein [Arenibacter sp. M-2]
MKGLKRVRAGALQFVLFIGTVIAILMMVFVLVSYSHSYFHKKTDLTVQLLQEAHYGLMSSFKKSIPLNDSVRTISKNNPEIAVTVDREFWGFFEKFRAKSEHASIQFRKIAFIGATNKAERPALYLKDRQRPLIIVGGAKITGEALLPEKGVRPGNISGHAYRNDQLIYGKVNNSGPDLPELDREKLIHTKKLLLQGPMVSEEPLVLKPNMEFKNSFGSPTQIFRDHTIYLDKVALIGNIIIMATDKITVGAMANLKDVVLSAPEIIIENGVQGTFQAIANRRIQVGNLVQLDYPSALIVMEDTKNVANRNAYNDNGIIIGKEAVVKGMLLYMNDSQEPRFKPQIKISSGSLIKGEIYCKGRLELKGEVYGSVIADSFIAMENGSIYQNHLYDGVINSSLLETEYVGFTLENKARKGVMKWLY